MIFKCKYNDGKTAAVYHTECELDENDLDFTFHDSLGNLMIWPISLTEIEDLGLVVHIRNKNIESGLITIENAEVIQRLKSVIKSKTKVSIYDKIINAGFKLHISIAAILIGVITIAYLFILPYLALHIAGLLPKDIDRKIGNLYYSGFISGKETIDTNKTKLLNEFAKNINFNNKDLDFYVVNNSIQNAFALPNGSIYVYSGILSNMESYDELAGLLSHEAAHINKRHSIKALSENLAGYLFISYAVSDVNGAMAVLANNAHTLKTLSYSREFEKEADIEGMEIMMQNGIDPLGLEKLFKRLPQNDDFRFLELLSTHPNTQDRIDYLKKRNKNDKFTVRENKILNELFEKIIKS